MFGQGIVPEDYETVTDALDEGKVAQAMEQMREDYPEAAQRLPTHGILLRMARRRRPNRSSRRSPFREAASARS